MLSAELMRNSCKQVPVFEDYVDQRTTWQNDTRLSTLEAQVSAESMLSDGSTGAFCKESDNRPDGLEAQASVERFKKFRH